MPSLPYFDKLIIVTGPYYNKVQKRNYVTYTIPNKKRTQKTYAKYLMEVHLGRALSSEEEVDHIDRDKTNDVIENLQILSAKEHRQIDVMKSKEIKMTCALDGCNNMFLKKAKDLRDQERKGCAGPFCGAVCRGKYGKQVQETGEKLPVQVGVPTELYYPHKKN